MSIFSINIHLPKRMSIEVFSLVRMNELLSLHNLKLAYLHLSMFSGELGDQNTIMIMKIIYSTLFGQSCFFPSENTHPHAF